ncbi:hypothetical protein GXW78_07515 [Roseomonas terrae]|uniref:Uncharacterized protein n=1 Tax=Neoroseomonas terrae TaxID=424799 RepID=A0ABS5EEQ5_9PROT|nr:hypothetical protein [Neoroseomonas terrae]MBR0649502.1 hypothetical protein [Neoroseomonas terrae]
MQKMVDGLLVEMSEEDLAQMEIDAERAALVLVPDSISRTQGLIALLGAGITEQMIRDRIALIENETEREVTRLRFEQQTWLRGSDFIAWGAEQFALTAEQVDGLFVTAVGL